MAGGEHGKGPSEQATYRKQQLGDPQAVLAAALDRLTTSEIWALTPRPDHLFLEAAVRPGVQWLRTEAIFGGDLGAMLIRGGHAYLYGFWQSAMIGAFRSDEVIEAVIGDRWLRCDAGAFHRAGSGHTALAQVMKLVRPDAVKVQQIGTSDAGRVAVLTEGHSVWAVRIDDPSGPLLIGFGATPAHGLLAGFDYNDDLDPPDPSHRGVITLEEARAGFAAHRRPSRPQRAERPHTRAAIVEVHPPEDDDLSWSVSSHDVLPAWGVESGCQAQELIQGLLDREAPEIVDELVFDSYGEAFFAYSASEYVAQALAELLRRKPS